MIDLARAIEIYRQHCGEVDVPAGDPTRSVIDRGPYFFFTYGAKIFGTIGLIIDKKDGALTRLGSGYTREEALWAYEKGLFRDGIDLVVTGYDGEVDAVIDVLTKNPASKRGDVYKPGRKGWYERLEKLPAVVFRNCAGLNQYVSDLWKAEQEGVFRFEVREHATENVRIAEPLQGSGI